ncbi:RabGAP/TBC [Rickenella mellea]|uniref:RabGAP/TBC n=1 Tax=Rickenella mellea TaxID=50990 RepID=A0A4Y7QFR4_9AGAM|nr:RabGAP/TBC [Rickenella mellea]
MTARPPPARPHIGITPSTRFSSYSAVDWGEDDAWDSASDSEEPRKPSKLTTSTTVDTHPPKKETQSPPSTKSRPIRKSPQNSSSSSLAFSYTHVQAPSPSSYPSKVEVPQPKNGWTIVRNDGEQMDAVVSEAVEDEAKVAEGADADLDEMVVGEMDFDGTTNRTSFSKARLGKEIIRGDADEIFKDPLRNLRRRRFTHGGGKPSRTRSSADSSATSAHIVRELSIRTNRRHKFVDCVTAEDVSIVELRKLSWNGIPDDLRPVAWQLLLGYLPLPTPLRASTLSRKREEYASLVELAFARGREGLDQQIWHQIEIDVPRTRPGVNLWMHGTTQRCIERILYVWAIRHPASGYVQGINDLVTPFFQVFLSAYINGDPEDIDPGLLPPTVLSAIEADSFWCLSRLLDGIQDNYIFAQPGIQRSVKRMAELVARIDAPLTAHLQSQNVEFMQFAFRWMNCLLMREMSVQNTIRLWDTYLAEGPDAFSQFHLYVCSAFLVKWSKKLQEMDFQGIIMFLQSLPTQDWTDHEIGLLLGEAFVLSSTWQNAQSHFSGK